MGNSIIQMTVQMTVEAGSPFPMWCHLERDVLQQLLCIIMEAESPSHQSWQRIPKAAAPSLKQITSGYKIIIVNSNQESRLHLRSPVHQASSTGQRQNIGSATCCVVWEQTSTSHNCDIPCEVKV